MTRHLTQFYQGKGYTSFAWADNDNDQFDRARDLEYLARALDEHDHSTGAGKQVNATQAIQANSIDGAMIKAGSITSLHIVDGQIGRVDLAPNIVDDSKLDVPRVKRTGDTMTDVLRIDRSAAPNTGYLYFGNGQTYIGFDGTRLVLQTTTGNPNLIINDIATYRNTPNEHMGALHFGSSGAGIMLWNGAQLTFRGYRVMTEETHVGVPIGGMIMVESMAVFNGLGSRWLRNDRMDGRMPIGNGVTNWGLWNDNANYGPTTNDWISSTGLNVTKGTLAVANGVVIGTANPTNETENVTIGGTGVSARGHSHGVTGNGAANSISGAPAISGGTGWYPPMRCVVFAMRVN